MKISTPNFGKHSFSSPSKSSIKKGKSFPPLKSIGTLLSPFPKVRQICDYKLVLGQSSQHTDFIFGGHKLEVPHYIIPSPGILVGKNVHFPA